MYLSQELGSHITCRMRELHFSNVVDVEETILKVSINFHFNKSSNLFELVQFRLRMNNDGALIFSGTKFVDSFARINARIFFRQVIDVQNGESVIKRLLIAIVLHQLTIIQVP